MRRFGVYLFTLWAAITVVFFVFRLVPGDPMSIMLGNLSRAEGHQPDPEEEKALIAHYRKIFGLDDPLPLQYVNYLRKAILGGLDLGPSFVEYPAQTRDLGIPGACPGRWAFSRPRCYWPGLWVRLWAR